MDPIMLAKLGAFAFRALPFLAAAAVGFSTAEALEHKAPWGLSHQLRVVRDSVPGEVNRAYSAGVAAQSATDKAAFGKWDAELSACRVQRQAARDDAAAAQSRADVNTSQQASAAFRLGKASCGATHATSPNDHPVSGPTAGGVRDPADDFAGLYAAGAFAPPR